MKADSFQRKTTRNLTSLHSLFNCETTVVDIPVHSNRICSGIQWAWTFLMERESWRRFWRLSLRSKAGLHPQAAVHPKGVGWTRSRPSFRVLRLDQRKVSVPVSIPLPP